jgi:type I restriction enzyme M protein
MWGSIVGDIVGSSFGIENNRSVYFEFFRKDAFFTKQTVGLVATMNILLNADQYSLSQKDREDLNLALLGYKKEYEEDSFPHISPDKANVEIRAFHYPFIKKGVNNFFQQWLETCYNKPYLSYGNTGLIRVGPVVLWAIKEDWSLQKTINTALSLNNITHNHEVAQKSVEAYTKILYLTLKDNESSIEDKKSKIIQIAKEYDLDVSKRVRNYVVNLSHNFNAQVTLEVILTCMKEAKDFKSLIANVVSCGGATDTYCSIAGALGEALWGVSDDLKESSTRYFNKYSSPLLKVVNDFYISVK